MNGQLMTKNLKHRKGPSSLSKTLTGTYLYDLFVDLQGAVATICSLFRFLPNLIAQFLGFVAMSH